MKVLGEKGVESASLRRGSTGTTHVLRLFPSLFKYKLLRGSWRGVVRKRREGRVGVYECNVDDRVRKV